MVKKGSQKYKNALFFENSVHFRKKYAKITTERRAYMKPFESEKLPITYPIDKELLSLLAEANEKFGEYKTALKNLEFDPKLFLDSILLQESLKSTQIEGTQISQDELYYLKYMPKNDENKEIYNLKKVIDFSESSRKENSKITLSFVNQLHQILLDSVRGKEKKPGSIRTIQNWIGPKGCQIEDATYIPPIPEQVPTLLENLFDYMNNQYIDPIFINLAIAHSQFETIHAYHDGNGRLGRALIPIQLSYLTNETPILFLSEVIELYKPSYYKLLNESRNGNMIQFIKFFLQCIIEQCNNYIYKIYKIKQIYKKDMELVKNIKGKSVYLIMPSILKQVIFTKKDIELDTKISRNVVSKVIDQLIQLGIIELDNTVAKKAYKYKEIYNVFVKN